MEIYLSDKGNLEIKSVRKEPWLESDLDNIFGHLRVVLIKEMFKYEDIERVLISNHCVDNLQKFYDSIKIVFKGRKPFPMKKLIGHPEFRVMFKFLMQPLISHAAID